MELASHGKIKDIPYMAGCTRNDIFVTEEMLEAGDRGQLYRGCGEWCLLLERLGRAPAYMYYFAKILKVSEGVLNNDFALASKWLERFDIELVRKPGLGVYLKGQEKSFREAYVNLIYDSFNEKEILDMVRNMNYKPYICTIS